MKKNISLCLLCAAIVSAVVGMFCLFAALAFVNETVGIVSFILITTSINLGGVAALFYPDSTETINK